eukprot:scaffold23462_cov66-Phaeocystis_antarctica.AAC.1
MGGHAETIAGGSVGRPIHRVCWSQAIRQQPLLLTLTLTLTLTRTRTRRSRATATTPPCCGSVHTRPTSWAASSSFTTDRGRRARASGRGSA